MTSYERHSCIQFWHCVRKHYIINPESVRKLIFTEILATWMKMKEI